MLQGVHLLFGGASESSDFFLSGDGGEGAAGVIDDVLELVDGLFCEIDVVPLFNGGDMWIVNERIHD